MYGVILSKVDVRDYKAVCTSALSLPEDFELNLCAVKNQGNVGSCVAHALASVIEYYHLLQEKETAIMSTGYIYGNRTHSDHKGWGMNVRDTLAALCEYGDVKHEDFPENIEVPDAIQLFQDRVESLSEQGKKQRITEYYSLQSEEDIKTALYNNIPVVIVMKWFRDIKVVDGVMQTDCGSYGSYHCMVIYGWNNEGWKVQNSWGETWGDNGRVIIPYYVPFREKWGVIDNQINQQLVQMEIKKPYRSKLGKIIAKILNKIFNLFKKK